MLSPVERLRESIYKSKSWLDVQNELADFDKYILEYLANGCRKIPEDSLDFFIEVISNKELYKKSEATLFLNKKWFYKYPPSKEQIDNKLLEVTYDNYPRYTDIVICEFICDMITNLIHSNDYDLQLIMLSRLFEQATFCGKEVIEIKLEVMKIHVEAILVDINKILNTKNKKLDYD